MSIERELLKEVLEYFDPLGLNTEHCEDLPERIKELLAQPEQEPEAWILEDKKTGYRRQSAYKPTDLDEEACNVIPLYTAPPKRESLTPRQGLEEYKKGYARAEIDLKREPLGLEIMDACGSEDYREGFKDGALYAEKCHGIGGE